AGRGRAVIPISVGVARTPPDEELAQRLLRLSVAVEEWMDDYQPDVVAIERLFERGNISTVLHTAHGVGVLMLAAAKRDIPVYMYTPSEVKKEIGRASCRERVQIAVMDVRVLGLSEAPKP